MNRDEIIRMAREAVTTFGCAFDPELDAPEWLDSFAAMVAAAEREEANRRSNAAWSLMCEKMVSAERAAFIAKIQGEIDHAHINNLRLTPPFGRMNGEVAVRASDLDAALDAIRAIGNHASS